MRIKREWFLCGALAAISGINTSQRVGAAPSCTDLTRPGLFPNTIVQTAAVVAADAKTGMPAFCEVRRRSRRSPARRSRRSTVCPRTGTAECWASVAAAGPAISPCLQPAVPDGPLQVGQSGSDARLCHGADRWRAFEPRTTDASWTRNNPVAVTDFSHRAIHEMTVVGKQVVASYYGRPRDEELLPGDAPTGGRMGMMETQRYPEDYDGVVAGAPVYSLLVQSSNVVRDQIFKAPGAALPRNRLKLVHEAVLLGLRCERRPERRRGHRSAPLWLGAEILAVQGRRRGHQLPDAAAGRSARQGVSNGTHTAVALSATTGSRAAARLAGIHSCPRRRGRATC